MLGVESDGNGLDGDSSTIPANNTPVYAPGFGGGGGGGGVASPVAAGDATPPAPPIILTPADFFTHVHTQQASLFRYCGSGKHYHD